MSEKDMVENWNLSHPIGTAVTYWPGVREGKGVKSVTRSRAEMMCDHASVWVEGEASSISLSHVEVLVKQPTDAELIEACAVFMGWHEVKLGPLVSLADSQNELVIYPVSAFNPLARPADTWLLLERVREPESDVEMQITVAPRGFDCRVSFSHSDDGYNAPSLARAICLAIYAYQQAQK